MKDSQEGDCIHSYPSAASTTKIFGRDDEEASYRRYSHARSPRPLSLATIEFSSLSFFDLRLAFAGSLEMVEDHLNDPHLTERLPSFEVDFEPDDPEDPKNWPMWYKGLTIATVSYSTWTVIFFSTSYTSGMSGMMKELGVKSEALATLGMTFFLLGMACGSLVMAPISEIYGRRPVYIVALLLFTLLVIPCAMASSLPEVIVTRFIGSFIGSAMSNAPGTVSDIMEDHYRALAFSLWSIGPMLGPITGPLIGGFVYEYIGWRWTNWLVIILGGVAWVMTSLIKESYAPAILRKRTAQRQKQTGDQRWWCRYDQKMSFAKALKVNLSRPFVLTFTEPILWFWDFYTAVLYGVMYLTFVVYPMIFTEMRGWSAGFSGLAFTGIGVGIFLVVAIEPLIRKMINAHKKDPETGKVTLEAPISVICIGAILSSIGQLVFAWTSLPVSIHWIWSILASVPFGSSITLVFIYGSNYLAGSYGIYAASAMAGNVVVRSILSGTLPLLGPTMYNALTPQWAGTLLGGILILMIPIPFVFYKWGKDIRMRSAVIRQLMADQDRAEKRRSTVASIGKEDLRIASMD